LKIYKKPVVSERNYREYNTNLKLHILPVIGHMKLSDVRQHDLQEILNMHAGESQSHIAHIKNAITGLFGKAFSNDLIARNPARELIIPVTSASLDGAPSHRELTDDEQRLFLIYSKGHYAEIFFKIIYYCGLRPEEVCALKSESIILNPGQEFITVSHAIENYTRREKPPKSKAGKRTVPIPASFAPELMAYMSDRRTSTSGYLFTTSDGRPMDTDDSCRWWRFLRNHIDKAAGAELYRNKIINHAFAPDITAYDLRHTYCTNLQRAGVPINVAKVFMGHNSIEVTARIYTHHTNDVSESARSAMNAFNNRFSEELSPNAQ